MNISTHFKTLAKTAVIAASTLLVSACFLTNSDIDESVIASSGYSDISSVKVKAGSQAPDFTLLDADNKQVTLSSVLKDNHALLVFYRGEWCPFCIDSLESFEAALPELAKQGVRLIAISGDSTTTNQNSQRRFGQNYLFLSDPSVSVAKAWGFNKSDNLAHPAMYLIKQDGTVAWYYVSEDFKTRPSGKQMLAVAKKHL
ncbi:peroxiredoxin family protein [Saccharobesus litoralis]|nr:peroxiredoxin-like family protein [Saccharobesus litoralis]